MEEFKNNVTKQSYTDEQILRKSQDLILNSLQQLLPSDFDFSELAKIFQLGNQSSPAQIVLDLIKYFISCLTNNFVYIKTYYLLEQQTQKLQSTIRSHIKIQQQMKMYLQYLQAKISKYQFQLLKNKPQKDPQSILQENQLLKSRQTILMKEKVIMLKQNQRLIRQIQRKNDQIKIISANLSQPQIKDHINFIKSYNEKNPKQYLSVQQNETHQPYQIIKLPTNDIKIPYLKKTMDEDFINNTQSYSNVLQMGYKNDDKINNKEGLYRINSQKTHSKDINKRSFVVYQKPNNINQKSQIYHINEFQDPNSNHPYTNFQQNRPRFESVGQLKKQQIPIRKTHMQSYSQVSDQRQINQYGVNKLSRVTITRPMDAEITQKKGSSNIQNIPENQERIFQYIRFRPNN